MYRKVTLDHYIMGFALLYIAQVCHPCRYRVDMCGRKNATPNLHPNLGPSESKVLQLAREPVRMLTGQLLRFCDENDVPTTLVPDLAIEVRPDLPKPLCRAAWFFLCYGLYRIDIRVIRKNAVNSREIGRRRKPIEGRIHPTLSKDTSWADKQLLRRLHFRRVVLAENSQGRRVTGQVTVHASLDLPGWTSFRPSTK